MPQSTKQRFYAHGKLLLTGEYFVLDGALALAVPTKLGQSLEVHQHAVEHLLWESYDHEGKCWFRGVFHPTSFTVLEASDQKVGERLQQILRAASNLFLGELNLGHHQISTHLEFPRNWGLGSSSTLIHNVSTWLNIDAYQLLNQTFGGSGYDLACAAATGAIFYQKRPAGVVVRSADFDPPFRKNLYFVFLNQKQNSRAGIAHYRASENEKKAPYIKEINELTKAWAQASNRDDMEQLIERHEYLVGEYTAQVPVGKRLFRDYFGKVKSLGAWGGDFVLAIGHDDTAKTKAWFQERGYVTVLTYEEMVLRGN